MSEEQKLPLPQQQASQQQQQSKFPYPVVPPCPPITINNSTCPQGGTAPAKPAKPATTTSTAPAKKPTTSTASRKAAAVLTAAEIDRMTDLGLGRGVDATDSKPWQNKTAFQVRRVTAESVIGTEEGGSLQSYEREVTSVSSHQTDIKSSVAVPQAPLEIGIDAEQSRSQSSTRRTVGKKVINRSVSFRTDFEDAPFSGDESASLGSTFLRNEPDSEISVANVQSEYYTFEERLSSWIVKRMLYRQELTAQEKVAAGVDPGEPKFVSSEVADGPLSTLSGFIHVADERERKEILRDCYDFVSQFHVTHYVSTIELGAAEYRVLSETEFTQRVGVGGVFGVEQLANLSVSHSSSWRKSKKASDLKSIGKISTDGRVSRGTHDEAVVGIRIQCVHTLIKLPFLKLALHKALLTYMDEQGDVSSGPFLVAFGTQENLHYWSVDQDHFTVGATDNIQNASIFFVNPNDDGKHPYEFQIAYNGDDARKLRRQISSLTPKHQCSIEPIPRYLSAPVSLLGFNSGPLRLKNHVSSESNFLLKSRMKKDELVSTHSWVHYRDMFFINCTRRRGRRDGFVCMRLQRRFGGREEWVTGCVPATRFHNEQSIFMLFRLVPASFREQASNQSSRTQGTDASGSGYVETLDEQLKNYEKGSAPDAFRVPPSPRPKRFLPFPLRRSGVSAEEPTSKPRVRFDVGGEPMLDIPSHSVSLPPPPPLAESTDTQL